MGIDPQVPPISQKLFPSEGFARRPLRRRTRRRFSAPSHEAEPRGLEDREDLCLCQRKLLCKQTAALLPPGWNQDFNMRVMPEQRHNDGEHAALISTSCFQTCGCDCQLMNYQVRLSRNRKGNQVIQHSSAEI